MPLIDGRFEILRERPAGGGRVRFHATDPEGRSVRIEWYPPESADARAFERHRRALKRLAREHGDEVALIDVVSRPGARYEVWHDLGEADELRPDAAWQRRLRDVGLPPEHCRLVRSGQRLLLAAAPFTVAEATDAAATAAEAGAGGVVAGGSGSGASDGRGGDAAHGAGPWRVVARRLARQARAQVHGKAARTWGASVLLLCAAIALLLVGWARNTVSEVVTVPEVTGLPVSEAIIQLAAAQLGAVPTAIASEGEAGTVLRSDPEAGSEVRPGRTVHLAFVRADAFAAALPSLIGRQEADARQRLDAADLQLGRLSRIPSRLPYGTVLAHRPASGEGLAAGGTVDLLVSAGPTPERTVLLDVVGLPLADATEQVRLAGLPRDRILTDRIDTDSAAPGTVVGMTPSPWHPVRLDGVTVRLLVAAPPAGVLPEPEPGATMPDLVGLSAEAAVAAAREAGLQVSVRGVAHASLPPGVVSHDPPPGAPQTGSVVLAVNDRPVPLPRPVVTVHEAEAELRQVPYRFLIEPGIPEQTARIRAHTLDGAVVTVLERRVVGGDLLDGTWLSEVVGPVTFELTLNELPYAELTVRRTLPADAPSDP